MIDHTLDSEKPQIIMQIFHLIETVENAEQMYYFLESYRKSLDKPFDHYFN